MFTGIIEELGRVREIERRGDDARVVFEANTVTEGSRDGDSIAVNGVCLTALDVKPDSFTADLSMETINRSTLLWLEVGAPVNLERAATTATRLGGHIVQGHVDVVGKFLQSENHGDSWTFRFFYPEKIARYLVPKGSIAVDGISLTIANLTDEYFEVAIIPKTLAVTNFSQLKPDDLVNLEVDVIAKHVERLLSVRPPERFASALDDQSPPLLRAALHFGFIVALIAINWYLFRLLHVNYFLWYLQKAPFITIAAGFLVPIITNMTAGLGLISTNPAIYAGACIQVVGVFVTAIGEWKSGAPLRLKPTSLYLGLTGGVARVFDGLLYPPLTLVLLVVSLGWLLTIAPISYFVTLIAGVPAREALRGKIQPISISESAGKVGFGSGKAVSFARDPFAITQAVSALLLFIAGMVYFRFA